MNKNMDTTDIDDPEITREQICCKCQQPNDVVILRCGHPMHIKCVVYNDLNTCFVCDNGVSYTNDDDALEHINTTGRKNRNKFCMFTVFLCWVLTVILLFYCWAVVDFAIKYETFEQRRQNDITYTCDILNITKKTKHKHIVEYDIFNISDNKTYEAVIDKKNKNELMNINADFPFETQCWFARKKYNKPRFIGKPGIYHYASRKEITIHNLEFATILLFPITVFAFICRIFCDD